MQLRHSFTLIELLVVIAIIAIIATVGLVSFNGAQKKTRDSKRRADLHDLKLAIEEYYSINGSYPTTGGTWWGESVNGGSRKTSYVPSLVPTFMRSLPNDPHVNQAQSCCSSGAGDVGYWYKSDGTDYKVQAWCTPETASATNSDPLTDPDLPGCSWQVSSSGATNW